MGSRAGGAGPSRRAWRCRNDEIIGSFGVVGSAIAGWGWRLGVLGPCVRACGDAGAPVCRFSQVWGGGFRVFRDVSGPALAAFSYGVYNTKAAILDCVRSG